MQHSTTKVVLYLYPVKPDIVLVRKESQAKPNRSLQRSRFIHLLKISFIELSVSGGA